MSSTHYCNEPGERGLTCSQSNLQPIRRLSDYSDRNSKKKEIVYRCKACRKLYKYIYSAVYQMRNYDCEEGWFELCDRYFKVGEIWVSSAPFPVDEARNYAGDVE